MAFDRHRDGFVGKEYEAVERCALRDVFQLHVLVREEVAGRKFFQQVVELRCADLLEHLCFQLERLGHSLGAVLARFGADEEPREFPESLLSIGERGGDFGLGVVVFADDIILVDQRNQRFTGIGDGLGQTIAVNFNLAAVHGSHVP